jgi:hypothetical protein
MGSIHFGLVGVQFVFNDFHVIFLFLSIGLIGLHFFVKGIQPGQHQFHHLLHFPNMTR